MGLATAVIAIALMLVVPGLADFITRIAMDAKNEISPANVGFALGVLFTVVGTLIFSAVHYTSWWLARR